MGFFKKKVSYGDTLGNTTQIHKDTEGGQLENRERVLVLRTR